MGRTNTLWIVSLYYDKTKKELIKTLQTNTLKDLSYLLNCELYDVSNFFHKITKPKGIFKLITIEKL